MDRMSISDLKTRLRRTDPLVLDIVLALSLAALVCVEILVVSRLRTHGGDFPVPPNVRDMRLPDVPSFFTFALAASAFLPLAVRRTVPWLALTLSGAAALIYQLQPMPPAFVVLGPMLALYALAAHSRRRHAGLIALAAAGVVVAVPVFALGSSERWVAEFVGAFVLLAASALLGDAERNRRAYVAEVEQRALDAERTREEEALRRVDEERIRISREVHDIVAHSLSIVTIQAGAAASLLDRGDDSGARASIENVRTTGKQALAELRSMLDVLRTGDADAPLAPAAELSNIEALVVPVREAGLGVELNVTGDLRSIPAYASVSAYRIVQEALTNIVRHAKAEHAVVNVTVTGRDLVIEITDDGSSAGVEPPQEHAGHGIRGMRERVDALGGSFEAGPGESGGFRVFATIPLSRGNS